MLMWVVYDEGGNIALLPRLALEHSRRHPLASERAIPSYDMKDQRRLNRRKRSSRDVKDVQLHLGQFRLSLRFVVLLRNCPPGVHEQR